MERALELGGFALAHAVWSIEDGEALIPMLLWENGEAQRNLVRFANGDLREAVGQAHEWLAAMPDDCLRAAFICDAFVTLDDGRSDALILRVVERVEGDMEIVLPYRPASLGFAIHRLKLGLPKGSPADRLPSLAQALLRGVRSHEQGNAVWTRALDESR